MRVNHLGQPLGDPVPQWTPPPSPPRSEMMGRYCGVVPLSADHSPDLWQAFAADRLGRDWTYLPYGPFPDPDRFGDWVVASASRGDTHFYAITVDDAAVGVASFLRIAPDEGSLEVGHLHFSPQLQGTTAATEAMYLMMRRAFETGYRRYEWKCNALNEASRAAAQRLGFSFEGVFRNAVVVKGHNRDTAWFACVDSEWPRLAAVYERWLDPANFDENGRQSTSLSDLTEPILVSRG